MARQRGNSNIHPKMRYIHFKNANRHGSVSICGHEGIHATNKVKKVTCQNCLHLIEKTA